MWYFVAGNLLSDSSQISRIDVEFIEYESTSAIFAGPNDTGQMQVVMASSFYFSIV